jgi:chemotaxis protein histidine kinase CheA
VIENGALTIEIHDDGRGVDWERARERARQLGLAPDTPAELTEALFADGMSTKTEVTSLSGRGVGLAALRAFVRGEGGQLTIVSEPQRGTCLRFDFPLDPPGERDLLADRHLPSRRQRLTS